VEGPETVRLRDRLQRAEFLQYVGYRLNRLAVETFFSTSGKVAMLAPEWTADV